MEMRAFVIAENPERPGDASPDRGLDKECPPTLEVAKNDSPGSQGARREREEVDAMTRQKVG